MFGDTSGVSFGSRVLAEGHGVTRQTISAIVRELQGKALGSGIVGSPSTTEELQGLGDLYTPVPVTSATGAPLTPLQQQQFLQRQQQQAQNPLSAAAVPANSVGSTLPPVAAPSRLRSATITAAMVQYRLPNLAVLAGVVGGPDWVSLAFLPSLCGPGGLWANTSSATSQIVDIGTDSGASLTSAPSPTLPGTGMTLLPATPPGVPTFTASAVLVRVVGVDRASTGYIRDASVVWVSALAYFGFFLLVISVVLVFMVRPLKGVPPAPRSRGSRAPPARRRRARDSDDYTSFSTQSYYSSYSYSYSFAP